MMKLVKRDKVRRTKFEKTIILLVFCIFTVYSFTLIYPFLWMFMNAGKTKMEFVGSFMSFPKVFMWSNFSDALFNTKISVGSGMATRQIGILQMFGTSLYLTLILTVLEVFISTCAAYVFCYYKFPGREVAYSVVIFALVVPLVGTLPVSYQFFSDVKLLDNLGGMIFLGANGLGFSFLILYGSFKNLSWSYAEAASIDGAGHFKTFFYVMLPLMRPAMTAMAVITAIGVWNDFTTPAIYFASNPTLSVGINTLMLEVKKSNNYPLMFASMIVAVVPIIIFFAVFQKTIMKNMIAGGLKG